MAGAAGGLGRVRHMITVKSCLHDAAPRHSLRAALRSSRLALLSSRSCRKQRSDALMFRDCGREGIVRPIRNPSDRIAKICKSAFSVRRAPSLNQEGFTTASTAMVTEQDGVETVARMDAEENQVEC
jgi:hypothetical protein